ncbi:MAG: SDR family NAD(P)-dependent oxidoreductase [Clostridia bacterium]|nr:SDR family NAD(P)-dependent oxidoreductase [Clostridia bacterium]
MKDLIKKIKSKEITLDGKTVAISGSTGGIGRELCFYLAGMGASLLMLDRSPRKANALMDELNKKFPKLCARHIALDLEDIENVKSVAAELEEIGIDYLLLNAGAYSIPRHKCSTGYDNVFQINFVSPYYLARRLLPVVKARRGRIVAVGSIAHRYSHIDASDTDFSTRKKASLVYGNAKRHLMFSLYLLDHEAISVTHPGITQTNITAHYPKLIYTIIKYPMRIIFMRPKKACLSILCGLFVPCFENEWIGPRIFDVWGLPKRSVLRSCDSDELSIIRSRAEKIYQGI